MLTNVSSERAATSSIRFLSSACSIHQEQETTSSFRALKGGFSLILWMHAACLLKQGNARQQFLNIIIMPLKGSARNIFGAAAMMLLFHLKHLRNARLRARAKTS